MASRLTPPLIPIGLMKLSNRWVLDGPNAWTDRNAIRVILDCTEVHDDMESRLRTIMAGFSSSGADDEVLDSGQVLAHLIIDLQQTAGEDVSFRWSAPGESPGTFEVVCEFYRSNVAVSAAALAVRILNHLVLGAESDFNFSDAFDRRVMRHFRHRELDQQREPIVRAAERRGIPFREITESIRLLELGSGAYQERFVGLMSTKVKEAASRMARNKMLTLSMLRDHGIPVPEGSVIESPTEALAVAERLGYPVIVKPVDRGHGRGVFIDILSPENLKSFATQALETSNSGRALVEKYIPGRDYRVLVLGDKVAAVAERIPAHVIGDGRQTIAELIAKENTHPDRGPGQQFRRCLIEIDAATDDALARQGLTIQDVPERGQYVPVKLVSNGSQGGTMADRTDEIHPENARAAVMTAQIMGMTVCGVDVRTPDIGIPLWDTGGVVLEVNSEPGFQAHTYVEEGQPRDIGQAMIDMLFPPGAPFRPVTVAMTHSPETSETGMLLERIMREAGHKTGLATSTGVAFGGAPFGTPPQEESISLSRVMRNPMVECAILEVGPLSIGQAGLPFRHVDAVLMLPAITHLGKAGPRDLATVLAGLVTPEGAIVIDANDDRFRHERKAEPHRWIEVSLESESLECAEHLQRGGRAVLIEDGAITLHAGNETIRLAQLNEQANSPLRTCMLRAAATAIALGVNTESIHAVVHKMS